MQIFLATVEILFLFFGAFVVALNWTALYTSYRNKQRDIDRYVSGMPGVPQISILIAAGIAHWVHVIHIPAWLFWLIALGDTTTFMLLGLPTFLFRGRKKQT